MSQMFLQIEIKKSFGSAASSSLSHQFSILISFRSLNQMRSLYHLVIAAGSYRHDNVPLRDDDGSAALACR